MSFQYMKVRNEQECTNTLAFFEKVIMMTLAILVQRI